MGHQEVPILSFTEPDISPVLDFGPETDARLERVAVLTGQPKNELARELVASGLYLIEYESSIMRDVEDIRTGRQVTYSLEEVEAELGLGFNRHSANSRD